MKTRLQLIDKFRRFNWFKGGDCYYFVLRVMDGSGTEAKIYERKVTRQCYYRFNLDDCLFSKNPAAKVQVAQAEEDF